MAPSAEMNAVHAKRDQRDSSSIAPIPAGRVLIVDNNASSAYALSKLVADEGHQAMTASDGPCALALVKQWAPDVVITDLVMPEMDGLELCRRVHELDPNLPVIITTAMEHTEAGLACLRAGADDYLPKPASTATLGWCLMRALERRAGKRERDRLRARRDELWEQLRAVNERLVVSSLREQERAETEAQQRAELSALLQGLNEGVVVADASGHPRIFNAAACAIFGIGPELHQAEALSAFEVRDSHGERLLEEQRPLYRAVHGDHFCELEVLYLRPDGERRSLVATGTSIKDADGTVTQAIVVFRDVTDLRRLERQREEYTALISHDLRNPLNVMLMSVDLLKKSLAEKHMAMDSQHVLRIERNAARMATMLEELTEATSLESSSPALRQAPCDFGALLRGVISQLDEPSTRRITVEANDAASCPLLADAEQLERCVTNLLTNALKYSAPDAPVQVRLSRTASHMKLEVIDRGIGIAPEDQKQIFTRYYRTAASRGHAEGLGLGLYITRMIVQAHGGHIDVRSEVGKGSTFSLILPLQLALSF